MSSSNPAPTGRAESGRAVARIGRTPYRTELELPEGHRLVADEPVFAGGGNSGPAPIDLLLAALTASRAATLRMEADRHGWPLDSAVVTARHRRVAARELGEARRGMVDIIDCEIELRGDEMTESHRRKLLERVARSWVDHALRHETRIETSLTS
jgi:uncharacterized OsmC-like protein